MFRLWRINLASTQKGNCECNLQKHNSPKQENMHVIILMTRLVLKFLFEGSVCMTLRTKTQETKNFKVRDGIK